MRPLFASGVPGGMELIVILLLFVLSLPVVVAVLLYRLVTGSDEADEEHVV